MADFPIYDRTLQQLMQERGLANFRQLYRQSGVSARQLLRLRRGELLQMRLEDVLKLSEALQVSPQRLLETFSDSGCDRLAPLSGAVGSPPEPTAEIEALQQEYARLQQQLEQQRELLMQEFQRSSLQAIESWLLSWSAAATKAKENPDLPAARLLPLVKPLEQLLQQWQVEAIATVGEELQYDPQLHQAIEGTVRPGEWVRVRYAGYRHRGQLLFRAKVSPVS